MPIRPCEWFNSPTVFVIPGIGRLISANLATVEMSPLTAGLTAIVWIVSPYFRFGAITFVYFRLPS
jgi:hypothetical protein